MYNDFIVISENTNLIEKYFFLHDLFVTRQWFRKKI